MDLRRPGADANLDLLVIVALALAASFPVHEISQFFHDNRETVGFGIVKGDFAAEFLPTVQTAISVLAGDDHARALQVRQCFAPDGPLQKKGIIRLAPQRDVHRLVAHTFSITQEYFLRFTTGQEFRPSFSHEFPAKQIRTRHEWRDLVLTPETSSQVKEIQLWLRHKHTFLHEWGQIRQHRPGYTALFYGPPGTGKTMTASLMGKVSGREVYRIDLSAVISKYIGETEKNLARIFDLAESRDWILFFDEADSLFGKRGRVNDARDRYANQDISFLLQRLEDFDGLSILASNLKSNIDGAFMRRFQSVIFFPLPGPEMRLLLWQKAIPSHARLEDTLDLKEVADKYALTGASIMNVVRFASLLAIDRNDLIIRKRDLIEGIRRGLLKEGKAM